MFFLLLCSYLVQLFFELFRRVLFWKSDVLLNEWNWSRFHLFGCFVPLSLFLVSFQIFQPQLFSPLFVGFRHGLLLLKNLLVIEDLLECWDSLLLVWLEHIDSLRQLIELVIEGRVLLTPNAVDDKILKFLWKVLVFCALFPSSDASLLAEF